jgi:hypothetical protein
MHVLFLGLFLTGLVLGVYSMLYGTERRARLAYAESTSAAQSTAPRPPRAFFNLATISAFAFVAGVTGYALDRWTAIETLWLTSISLSGGLVAFVGQALLLALWVIPSAAHDTVDPRYALQGTPARVLSDLSAHDTGSITYAFNGAESVLPARAMHATTNLTKATDVVIDRVEDGVAYVEPWSVVEQRL